MDPFEVRMQCLSLLRRLNASQQSIQKVVAYSLKYFSRCGDLIWDCIVEECQKGSLNTRINILYMLDSLCEASLISKAASASALGPGPSSTSAASIPGGGNKENQNLYVDFVARDLAMIVGYVVPPGREGLINLTSAVQILENWRNKRILDPQKVDEVLSKLESQKTSITTASTTTAQPPAPLPSASEDTSSSVPLASATFGFGSATGTGAGTGVGEESATSASSAFSRNEIFKRIEEDRERHKRLRERRWVQPPLLTEKVGPLLASFAPLPVEGDLEEGPELKPEMGQGETDAKTDASTAVNNRLEPSSEGNSANPDENADLNAKAEMNPDSIVVDPASNANPNSAAPSLSTPTPAPSAPGVAPTPQAQVSTLAPGLAASSAAPAPTSDLLPLDIEFDNAWETTSDWNEDDDDAVAEENALCFPNAAVRFGSGFGEGSVENYGLRLGDGIGPGPGPGPNELYPHQRPTVTETSSTMAPASNQTFVPQKTAHNHKGDRPARAFGTRRDF